jgi:hypothetical protein
MSDHETMILARYNSAAPGLVGAALGRIQGENDELTCVPT